MYVDRQVVQRLHRVAHGLFAHRERILIGKHARFQATCCDQITLQCLDVDIPHHSSGRPGRQRSRHSGSVALVLQVSLHARQGHGVPVNTCAQARDQQPFQPLRRQAAVGHVAGVDRAFHVFDQKHLGVGQSPRVKVALVVRDGVRKRALGEDVLGGEDVVADDAPAVPGIDQLPHIVFSAAVRSLREQ